MSDYILDIKNLQVEYRGTKNLRALKGIDLKIKKGENVGIIGESGSGKTTLAMAIMNIIKEPHRVGGKILYKGKDLNKLSDKELNEVRWNKISLVFQNNLDVLNPLMTVEEQILESLNKDRKIGKNERRDLIIDLLEQVGLDSKIKDYYPHQLSGGMRQKILIAMGLACKPELMIVDEPTSALDILSKREIITLLKSLQSQEDMTLVVISHELDTILELTEEVNVIYGGNIIERGKTREVIENPKHVYTRGLISSSPSIDPFGDMWGIPGEFCEKGEGCLFQNRCVQSVDKCKKLKPKLEKIDQNRYVACNRKGIVELLSARNIYKTYKNKNNIVEACKDCNLSIKFGEIVALIGESGSGKTSLASVISGLLDRDRGSVLFEGRDVLGNNFTSRKKGIQMVFQDPYSSINENLTIEDVVGEPLKIIGDVENLDKKVKEALFYVNFTCDNLTMKKKCYELSGGQRQRIALARSLIMEPKLLVADEISSMLDPSTQANILRLLKGLQNKLGFSMLYITHDLAVARKIADEIYIMKDGLIVENGPKNKIFIDPKNKYTKKLISSII